VVRGTLRTRYGFRQPAQAGRDRTWKSCSWSRLLAAPKSVTYKRSLQAVGEIASRVGGIEDTHEVGKQAQPSESVDGRLRRFGFLFPMHVGHEGNVDECKVLRSNTELELSHRLDERCGFNVTNGSTELKQTINRRGMIAIG